MRNSAIRPRPDQIAELTRGIQLPLPAIADVHLKVLAECLHKAFDDVGVEQSIVMVEGGESEVTAMIETRLNRLINEENSPWGQLVSYVARGKESPSFDGSHLEKRPDLSICLSDRARLNFPLIVEAKILDATRAKTAASYCNQGLRRFINGEYAWSNREAFMIGYVRDGSSIDAKLTPFLGKAMALNPSKYLVEELPVHVGSGTLDLAYTRHGRDFVYSRQAPPNRPGAISVWHLWLS